MWELDHKEGWVPKNWCFQTMMLEKALESPLNDKEIRPVNPKGKWKSLSHVRLFVTPWLHSPWNSPGQIPGVGSLSLLQRIFPTQKSNWGLLHCRQILYQLSYEGSPYPKGNQPEYSLEELMLKLKFQYFGHLMHRADTMEKTLMLGKTEGSRTG